MKIFDLTSRLRVGLLLTFIAAIACSGVEPKTATGVPDATDATPGAPDTVSGSSTPLIVLSDDGG